ncbi:MAG: hypothetical protein ACLGH3_09250 [Actinomycetota bacterium]
MELEFAALIGGDLAALGELVLGLDAALDPLRKLNLLLGGQQRVSADLTQVCAQRVEVAEPVGILGPEDDRAVVVVLRGSFSRLREQLGIIDVQFVCGEIRRSHKRAQ